jgi:hypothetical protein
LQRNRAAARFCPANNEELPCINFSKRPPDSS